MLLLAWAFLGESPWPLALLRFTPGAIYVIPILSLALWGCLRRRSGWKLPLALAGLVVALGIGAPAFSPVRSDSATLRVITMNIGQARTVGPTDNADILFLQEVPPGHRPARRVRQQLADYAGVQSVRKKELMVFSRFPIVGQRDVPLGPGFWALEVDLEIGARSM